MKVIVVVLFLLLIAVALYLGLSIPSVAPPEGLPVSATAQDVSTPAPVVAPVSTGAGSAAKPGTAAVTSTVNDVKQAVDYATGYTPLKIKKSSEKKIKDISAAHNAEVEKAVNEN